MKLSVLSEILLQTKGEVLFTNVDYINAELGSGENTRSSTLQMLFLVEIMNTVNHWCTCLNTVIGYTLTCLVLVYPFLSSFF